jgi:hypothetical protein
MNIPDGTGFGIVGMMSGERYLMSGADALNPENFIKLFEALKGRKATQEEITNVDGR